MFTKGSKAVEDLKTIAKQLRKLPVVEPTIPTVALVGAPNVGKSSLVQVRWHVLPLDGGAQRGLVWTCGYGLHACRAAWGRDTC